MTTPAVFDADWYLINNKDVAEAGVDAYEHFLASGLYEGRSAGNFVESYYLNAFPDVVAAIQAGVFASGWEHYSTYGYDQGRRFSGEMYAQGAAGDDYLNGQGSTFYDSIFIAYGTDFTIYGFEGNDVLVGGHREDQIFGGTGNDMLSGLAGTDTLSGGDGDDTLKGGLGQSDVMYGGFGSDSIFGNGLMYGNQNADWISGGVGDDTIYGGQNNGPAGADGVMREGADTIYSGGGRNLIYGNHGGDLIYAESPETNGCTIYGGQDNDTIISSSGSKSIIFGNKGDDLFTGEDSQWATWRDTILGGEGADTVRPAATTYQSTSFDWADFNPDEGDRIDLSAYDSPIVTQTGTVVSAYSDTSPFETGNVSIDVYRTGFSTDWLIL